MAHQTDQTEIAYRVTCCLLFQISKPHFVVVVVAVVVVVLIKPKYQVASEAIEPTKHKWPWIVGLLMLHRSNHLILNHLSLTCVRSASSLFIMSLTGCYQVSSMGVSVLPKLIIDCIWPISPSITFYKHPIISVHTRRCPHHRQEIWHEISLWGVSYQSLCGCVSVLWLEDLAVKSPI